jgi:hypothetical protein
MSGQLHTPGDLHTEKVAPKLSASCAEGSGSLLLVPGIETRFFVRPACSVSLSTDRVEYRIKEQQDEYVCKIVRHVRYSV